MATGCVKITGYLTPDDDELDDNGDLTSEAWEKYAEHFLDLEDFTSEPED
ncbi:hypothetical protein [Microbacterium sp. T32]|nr:hypothetical protein [Microbacterium sp. T32]